MAARYLTRTASDALIILIVTARPVGDAIHGSLWLFAQHTPRADAPIMFAYKRAATFAFKASRSTPASHTLKHTPVHIPHLITPRIYCKAMSTAIVLPQLPEWFEGRLKALYTAKTVQEFDEAFELFVSKHATIRVNGQNIDRDQYKQMIQGEIKTDVGADVTFQGLVTVPPKGSNDSYVSA